MTRRMTEAAAGGPEQYVEVDVVAQRSICEHIRRCSRQLVKNAGWNRRSALKKVKIPTFTACDGTRAFSQELYECELDGFCVC